MNLDLRPGLLVVVLFVACLVMLRVVTDRALEAKTSLPRVAKDHPMKTFVRGADVLE